MKYQTIIIILLLLFVVYLGYKYYPSQNGRIATSGRSKKKAKVIWQTQQCSVTPQDAENVQSPAGDMPADAENGSAGFSETVVNAAEVFTEAGNDDGDAAAVANLPTNIEQIDDTTTDGVSDLNVPPIE